MVRQGRVGVNSRSPPCRPRSSRRSMTSMLAERSTLSAVRCCSRAARKTHFAMAQQDVRYYLNGLLLIETGGSTLAGGGDGRASTRAMCQVEVDGGKAAGRSGHRALGKGVLELQRLLQRRRRVVGLSLGSNHIRIQLDGIRFTSKLIDGRFPSTIGSSRRTRAMNWSADRNLLKGRDATDGNLVERKVPRYSPDVGQRMATEAAGAQPGAGRS